jgi:hypothetical protein
MLKDRFGSKHKIYQACITKIESAANVKTAEQLREYADMINGWVETMIAIDKTRDIERLSSMVEIVEKLPKKHQDSWKRYAYDLSRTQDRDPYITELRDFLLKAADVANLPHGYESLGNDDNKASNNTRDKQKTTTFITSTSDDSGHLSVTTCATSTGSTKGRNNKTTKMADRSESFDNGSNSAKCILCEQQHPLEKCKVFLKEPARKRLDNVKEHRLCYSCLLPNHRRRTCATKKRCQGWNSTYVSHSIILIYSALAY